MLKDKTLVKEIEHKVDIIELKELDESIPVLLDMQSYIPVEKVILWELYTELIINMKLLKGLDVFRKSLVT